MTIYHYFDANHTLWGYLYPEDKIPFSLAMGDEVEVPLLVNPSHHFGSQYCVTLLPAGVLYLDAFWLTPILSKQHSKTVHVAFSVDKDDTLLLVFDEYYTESTIPYNGGDIIIVPMIVINIYPSKYGLTANGLFVNLMPLGDKNNDFIRVDPNQIHIQKRE